MIVFPGVKVTLSLMGDTIADSIGALVLAAETDMSVGDKVTWFLQE